MPIRSGGEISAPISTTTSPSPNRATSGRKPRSTTVAPAVLAADRWLGAALLPRCKSISRVPNFHGRNVSVPFLSRKLDGAMIPPTVVTEIKRLLTQPGLSQRKVAVITGVSRASVGAIAAGRRPDYPTRCNPHDEEDLPQGPVARCGSCGGIVYMPCRLCRIRFRSKPRNASDHAAEPPATQPGNCVVAQAAPLARVNSGPACIIIILPSLAVPQGRKPPWQDVADALPLPLAGSPKPPAHLRFCVGCCRGAGVARTGRGPVAGRGFKRGSRSRRAFDCNSSAASPSFASPSR